LYRVYKGAVSVPFSPTFINRLNDLTTDAVAGVFVVTDENAAEVYKTLRASGLTTPKGFAKGDYISWQTDKIPVDVLITIEADEFAIDYQYDEFYLVDIRSAEEFAPEHPEDAENIALNDLEQLLPDLESSDSYYIYGDTAENAVTAGSVFKSFGFERVRVVSATFNDIKNAGVPWYTQKKKPSANK